jgi:hypothetical protein
VLGNERLTGALLDRITHRVHILEANGESYRLKDAEKRARRRRKEEYENGVSPSGEAGGKANTSITIEFPQLPGDNLGSGCYTSTPPPASLLDRRRQKGPSVS